MDIEDIELKSEEIQEILSRPPHALIRWGITVFFMVISFLFIGGCFFSYPDTVEAGITITTENPHMDCSAEYRKIKGSLLERQAKSKGRRTDRRCQQSGRYPGGALTEEGIGSFPNK